MTSEVILTRNLPHLPRRWNSLALAAGLGLACFQSTPAAEPAASTAVPVRLDGATGMTRGGKPYFVKGAGGGDRLKELAGRGGNSLRTWTTNGLDTLLDEANPLGITISAGIWLEPECGWFSYKNPEQCAKQAERVRKEVMLYRTYPALLAWGLGNEVEGDGTNVAYWKQLDRLALLVKEIDPAHPTFTAVAGFNPAKVAGMNAHTPNLDYVGINTYGSLPSLRKHLQKHKWQRPWLVTEWGPRGFWESPKSASGAPLEQTSSEKADMIRKAYQATISNDAGCLGSYVFVWAWKFEATATWFGLFTHEGETTAAVDALQEMWAAGKPANQAPAIKPLQGVSKSHLKPNAPFDAIAQATDPDRDPLTWHWAVLPEQIGHDASKRLPMPTPVKGAIINTSGDRASVKAPTKPGIYRLHVWVKDGKGHAATANMPFEVR